MNRQTNKTEEKALKQTLQHIEIEHVIKVAPQTTAAAAAAASCFSHVQLCAIPQTAAHQAPLSLGFSRQEYWSGLPFPSPLKPLGRNILK